MPACAVFNCFKKSKTSSLQKDGVTFHFFPRDTSMRQKWIDACNRHRTWASTRTSTICSIHFESSQFYNNMCSSRRRLVPHAVPTLFLSDTVPVIEQVIIKQENIDADEDQINGDQINGDQINQNKINQDQVNRDQTDEDTSQNVFQNTDAQNDPDTESSHVVLCEPWMVHNEAGSLKESLPNYPQVATPREKKLSRRLIMKTKEIKRLHSKIRYLKKKVETLEDILKDRKSVISEEV